MRRKSRKILQRKRLTATQPNYSLAFTKWLGRSLTRHEKQVIMTLEQMRQRGETVRIHIHDHYGVDSREILTEYLRWLMELEPIEEGAFVCITKKEAKERSRHFRKKPLTSGHWKVDSLRSFTVKFALKLDITRYDWLKLDIGALAPCIPITAQNAAFIIHTDPDTCLYIPPAYRVPYFKRIKQEVLEYIDVVYLAPDDSAEESPPPNKLLNQTLLNEYGEAVLPQAAAAPAVNSQNGSKSTLTFWNNCLVLK